MQGFLNLNKPAGFTSHDCVAKVRRLLQLKRVGHGGTLDPAATGVLPIGLGRATRLLQYLPPNKAYRAVIRFGVITTTDDLEGEILLAQPVPDLTLEKVTALLPQFQGTIEQIPPRYSAVQVQGKRLYDLARQGEVVAPPVRTVEVHQIRVLDWRPGRFPELAVAIACGSGTYIRAIARDLGNVLDAGAVLVSLVRTDSGGLSLAHSLNLEQIADQIQAGTFQPISPQTGLQHLSALTLPPQQAKRWRQGQKIPLTAQTNDIVLGHPFRVENNQGQFLGIGEVVNLAEESAIAPKMVFEPIS